MNECCSFQFNNSKKKNSIDKIAVTKQLPIRMSGRLVKRITTKKRMQLMVSPFFLLLGWPRVIQYAMRRGGV